MTVVEGPGIFMGDTEVREGVHVSRQVDLPSLRCSLPLQMDALLAKTLETPVMLTMNVHGNSSVNEIYNHIMMKRQVFADHHVSVLGVALNRVPRGDHTMMTRKLREMLEDAGIGFMGGIPEDSLLSVVRC